MLLESGYRVIAGKVVAPESPSDPYPAEDAPSAAAEDSTEVPLRDLEIEPDTLPEAEVDAPGSQVEQPEVPVPDLEQGLARDVEVLESTLVVDSGSHDVADFEKPEVAESPDPPGTPPDWLEQVDAKAVEEAGEQLFSEEEAFFDLAAELQDILAEGEPGAGDAASHEPGEQSLEEIVAGFKRGVAENIGEEEADTHYNLGIAYREMMLLDEAIGEFQISGKDPLYTVDSWAMLGLCFLDKGLPDLAVKWYLRALGTPGVQEERRLGMLYDLGTAHEANGDPGAAYAAYLEIHGTQSDYREVAGKLEELRAGAPEA